MKCKLLNKNLKTHGPKLCKGQNCVLHNPSKHSMVKFPVFIRMDKFTLAERICPHGVGHPDPDSVSFLRKYVPLMVLALHGCDGCCSKEARHGKTR